MLHPIVPITDRRIRIALVGCGRISANHIRAFAFHQDRAELVAICDTQAERLEKAQQLITEAAAEYPGAATNPKQFNSYSELLAATQNNTTPIDMVVLATPSGLHPGQVIAAAEAGLHVCTEKPMATRWADGVLMVKACDQAGVHLFVVKQNRFNSTLQLVKRQLQAGHWRWWR